MSPLLPGFLISLSFLSVNLLNLPHHGLFWDHFFHLNAGLKFLHIPPPHPTNLDDQPYGPLSAIPGALTYHLLYQKYHILPPDVAYNIPNVVAGSVGVFAVYLFALEIFHSTSLAATTSLTLALYPRFLGHSHVNPKDPLVSSLICLSLYFLYKWTVDTAMHHQTKLQISFLKKFTQPAPCISFHPKRVLLAGEYVDSTERVSHSGTIKSATIGSEKSGISASSQLLLSSLTTALAFNTKINAVLIPPIFLSWRFLLSLPRTRPQRWNLRSVYPQQFLQKLYKGVLKFVIWLLLSTFLSLTIWSLFWSDPWIQLRNLFTFFSGATHGYYLLNWGSLIQSNISMPPYYPLQILLLTTPALMIFTATFGFAKCTIDTLRKRNSYSPLLIVWFLIPILKYLTPHVGFSDDTRHFMEVFYPLAIFSTIGLYQIRRLLPHLASRLLLPLFLIYLLFQSLPLYPYEISYYTDAIGGTRGANTLFDIDQFGLSLKDATNYLNRTAPPQSTIYIPITSATARPYLRADLTLIPDFITQFRTEPSLTTADYVVIVNHPSLFAIYDPGILTYISSREPSYTVSRSRTPFAWVFRN